jgi:hypothetical protein
MAEEKQYMKRERELGYFHPTPEHFTEALLRAERFTGMKIWEPACGTGSISRVLEAHGLDVYSSDITDRGYGEVADFFDTEIECDAIITNPLWLDTEELRWHFWLRHALDVAKRKVALLMPAYFWDSRRRRRFLSQSPLKSINVFVDLAFQQHAIAWWIWDKKYKGLPQVRWLR